MSGNNYNEMYQAPQNNQQQGSDGDNNGKKKKSGKGCLVAIVIFLLLGAIGSCFGGNGDTEDSSVMDNNSITETAPTEGNTEIEDEETEEEIPVHRDGMVGISDKSLADDGIDVTFSDSVLNDVTGNWRLARIAATIDITEYAVDYYNTYFKSDDEIHVVVNFTTNTTTIIRYMFGQLSVTIHEYVDKEELDAKVLGGGMALGDYFIYLDNGDIENLGVIEPDEPDTMAEETDVPSSEENISLGMQNALKKAESYLKFSAFSYTGLIEQLEYEEFLHEEAVYGADNCGADWSEQALKKLRVI